MSFFSVIKGLFNNNPTPIKVDESGSIFSVPNSIISDNNNYTGSFTSGSSWSGSAELNTYQDVMVICKTDADGTLYLDFSPDGINWDSSITATITSGTPEFHTALKGPRYYRTRYINGSTAPSYFRLYTYYGQFRQGNLPLNSTIRNDSDATVVRSIITGETDGGKYLNVPVDNLGHLEVALHSPRLPFGSIHTENTTPVFQTDAVYGLNAGQVVYGSTLSGDVLTSQSMFNISTGNTIYSQAFLQSRKRLRYRPGQGVIGMFTAVFSEPISSSYQVIGFGHAEDGLYIGYSGSVFGILHSSFGVREQQLLDITTPSNINQNVIVTLSGVTHSVAVTNSNNINTMAWELSQGTYSGWKAEPTGSAVLFTSDSAGNKIGIFNLSGSAGVTGSYTEIQAGLTSTETFISQSQWFDPMDGTGNSGAILNQQRGNVYKIGIQYLGFGPQTVQIEINTSENNPDFIPIYSFDFPNNRTFPTYGNPSFPFSMAVYSAGSTTDLSIKCASFAGMIEGQIYLNGNNYTYRNSKTSISTTENTALYTIYNSRRFGNRTNQSVVNLLNISYACRLSTNAYGEFLLVKNGNLTGAPNFSNYDTWSCTTFDTGSTAVIPYSNEDIIFSLPVGETTDGIVDISSLGLELQPGEWVTAAMKLGAGTATFSNITINTREDQ